MPDVIETMPAGVDQTEACATLGFGLHMEAAYLLECAVELGEITPMEEMVFRVENPAALDFINRTDRNEALPRHWLRNTARQYLSTLDREERLVWALHSLPGLELGLKSLRDRMAFVVQSKVQSDLGVVEQLRLDWLDEVTPHLINAPVFSSVHEVTPASVCAFLAEHYGQTRALLEEDLELCRDALSWVHQPGNRARAKRIAEKLFLALPHASDSSLEGLRPVEMVRQAQAKRKAQRRARSAIKKALKLFNRTGLDDSVRLMAHGKEVTLQHPASPFKFVLNPLQPGWLESRTTSPGRHVPYQLTLLTKEDVFLSRLCVLFDKTPVLDQLLALTFFVQSGNEEELLSKANWFGYEDAQLVRSVLSDKAPALVSKVPAGSSTRGPGQAGHMDRLILAHNEQELHWAPFKGPVDTWIANWMAELFEGLSTLKGVDRLAA